MSQGVADSASFLEARLARCRALPEHQRSPDVAAFVLCADLQAQAAASLAARPARSLERRRQELLLFSLKVTASHCCRLGESVLSYCGDVLRAADERLHILLAHGAGGSNRSHSCQLGALLEQDCSLASLLTVAAALPMTKLHSSSSELLPVVNRMVVQLQQPAEAARLRQELAVAQAQLPAPLLSYDQLLALFVVFSCFRAADIALGTPACLVADVEQACRAAAVLLPRLVPEHLPWQFQAATCVRFLKGSYQQSLLQLREVMQAAEKQGSDYTVAECGCQLAANAHEHWARTGCTDGEQEVGTPSDVLGWVRQAREARRRCETLLPQQWTAGLASRHKIFKMVKPWLQQLQQEGDRWRPMDAGAKRVFDNAIDTVIPQLLHRPGATLECSGCGECAPHLKRCAGCKITQYCSSKCQHAHWPQHRAACKAEQRRQQQPQ